MFAVSVVVGDDVSGAIALPPRDESTPPRPPELLPVPVPALSCSSASLDRSTAAVPISACRLSRSEATIAMRCSSSRADK